MMCAATGLVTEAICRLAGMVFLDDFLAASLIPILITLMAINTATIGLILNSLLALPNSKGKMGAFKNTVSEMKFSIKEQMWLIIVAAVCLSVKSIDSVQQKDTAMFMLSSASIFVFVYALRLLFDTSQAVFVAFEKASE